MLRAALAVTALTLLINPATAAAIEATGLDAITTPGHPVDVGAKFERKLFASFKPDMRREPVTFGVAGQTLHGVTDRDGVARAQVTPTATGVYEITGTLDRHTRAPASSSRLWVLDPAKECVVVDLDQTISNMNPFLVFFDGDKAKTFDQAPEVLRELSGRYQIVYLTARDDGMTRKTRGFLARHGFPDGPCLFNDLGITTPEERAMLNPQNHSQYKLKTLRELQARGVHPAIGIGNTATDALAYEGAGMASFLLTSKPKRLPVGGASVRFDTYAQLRTLLIALHALPPVTVTTGLASAVSSTP